MEKPTEKKEHKIHFKKCCTNNSHIVSFVLLVLLIISIFTAGFNFGTSKQKAADKALEFINTQMLQQGMAAEINSVTQEKGLYKINLIIEGEEFDSYVTKDGSILFPSAIPLEQTSTPTTAATAEINVPKSEKPKVELFIMSHCPFGTQAEKGMIPVIEHLGNAVDFDMKYVYYAMHGKTELDEQLNQYCIQKEQNNKFFPYLKCFLDKGDGESCLVQEEIDKSKMQTCVEKVDKEFKVTELYNDKSTWLSGQFPLFNPDKELNDKYDIGGSPSLVINGEKVSSSRSPDAYLNAICQAFVITPEECEAQLSTETPSSGFGFDTTTSTTAGSCG